MAHAWASLAPRSYVGEFVEDDASELQRRSELGEPARLIDNVSRSSNCAMPLTVAGFFGGIVHPAASVPAIQPNVMAGPSVAPAPG